MQTATSDSVLFSTTTNPFDMDNGTDFDDCNKFDPGTETNEYDEFESVVRIMVPIIFGAICLLGLIGNTLVIIVVLSNKNMRITMNILMVSLAFADLLFIIFCVPFTAVGYAMPIWPFGTIWCKIVKYLTYVFAYASVYTLVLMALVRYLAVVHPFRTMLFRSVKDVCIIVALIWILILVGNIPLLFEFGVVEYSHRCELRSACLNMAQNADQYRGKVFFGCFFVIGYVLPLSLVCILYGLTMKRLLYTVGQADDNQYTENWQSKRRATKMVVVVVAVFAVCWLPIQLILLIQQFGDYPHNIPSLGTQMASNCLSYMNSCMNPFLYAFLSEHFRKSFKKILGCKITNSNSSMTVMTNITRCQNQRS